MPSDAAYPAAAPRCRSWSRVWRYLVAIGVGLTAWAISAAEHTNFAPEPEGVGGRR